MKHGYETGRLDLPFVGICSFGKYPIQLDWDRIGGDVAMLGAPFDGGTQWRLRLRERRAPAVWEAVLAA